MHGSYAPHRFAARCGLHNIKPTYRRSRLCDEGVSKNECDMDLISNGFDSKVFVVDVTDPVSYQVQVRRVNLTVLFC